MYSRYKVSRKNNAVVRFIIFLAVAGVLVYFGHRNRQYLFFWKYTSNRIVKRIEQAAKMKNGPMRDAALTELGGIMKSYRKDNPLAPDVYLQAGRVEFLTAESALPGTFSELVINDSVHDLPSRARIHFIRSIKDFRKAAALTDDGSLPAESALLLARASYHTGYKTPEEIYDILQKHRVPGSVTGTEGARFCALIEIVSGRVDKGLERLVDNGDVFDSLQGRLLLATAERTGRRYTNAIMHYREVAGLTSDKKILKLVNINLGKLYFNQSLYQESITHFNRALELDSEDSESRIWLGKNYARLGDRVKAKAVWTEVLTRDSSNDEARKLLGIM